jgi:hypothetical protein
MSFSDRKKKQVNVMVALRLWEAQEKKVEMIFHEEEGREIPSERCDGRKTDRD